MTPRHPLSAPDLPLYEAVLWLHERVLDLESDLTVLMEQYERRPVLDVQEREDEVLEPRAINVGDAGGA